MRSRCNDKGHHAYERYGGRGITVCARWSWYANFLEDMGRRPSSKHSLEREKNELGYNPENCVWATAKEQQNNTCSNRRITHDGRTQTMSQWARELQLPKATLQARLRRGWPLERALTAHA